MITADSFLELVIVSDKMKVKGRKNISTASRFSMHWSTKLNHCQINNKRKSIQIRNICQDRDIEVIGKWYEHKQESVTHNKDSKIAIMWDMQVNTDSTITANNSEIDGEARLHTFLLTHLLASPVGKKKRSLFLEHKLKKYISSVFVLILFVLMQI